MSEFRKRGFLLSAFQRRLDAMHRIGFIAYPDFQVLSLCTVSAFECANILSAKPLYELQKGVHP
jgi:hypothetical protein